MNAVKDFDRLYADVARSIASATGDIEELRVEHRDGKQELSNMLSKLRGIQARFDDELELLKEHAEWDKFTIAFFGETNAGKSTILESLRILFNEESRHQLLEQNERDLEKYETALAQHVNRVRTGLGMVYTEYATQIASIQAGTRALGQLLQEEIAGRLLIIKNEGKARLQHEQNESATRLQIADNEVSMRLALERQNADTLCRITENERAARLKIDQDQAAALLKIAQDESSTRVKFRLFLSAAIGIVSGGGIASAVLMLLRS